MTGLKSIMDIEITLPTDQEMTQMSEEWIKTIGPVLLDRLPAPIKALGPQTSYVSLTQTEVRALLDAYDNKMDEDVLNRIVTRLDAELGWNRKFWKLNSRSAKEAGAYALITCSGKQILTTMWSSERIMDDLARFAYLPDDTCKICLRDILYYMTDETEFRCFVVNGDLKAISQYHYNRPFNYLQNDDIRNSIKQSILTWYEAHLKDHIPVDNIVFDISHEGTNSITLIELNPFGLSDPCAIGSYEDISTVVDGGILFAYTPEK